MQQVEGGQESKFLRMEMNHEAHGRWHVVKADFRPFHSWSPLNLFRCPPSKMERTRGWLWFVGQLWFMERDSYLCLIVQHMDPVDGECAHPSRVPAPLGLSWLGHRALRAPAPCLGTLQLWGLCFPVSNRKYNSKMLCNLGRAGQFWGQGLGCLCSGGSCINVCLIESHYSF